MYSFIMGIVGLNLFALVTVLARPRLFRVRLYRPMLKNIGLSVLPVVVLGAALAVTVACLALSGHEGGLAWLNAAALGIAVLGMLAWLLLLPNAGYLITELNLNHRAADEREVPLYFDIIAVLSLSMSGVMNTLANVWIAQVLIGVLASPADVFAFLDTWPMRLFSLGVYALVSVGIYLGRYIRFNSWDIIRPHRFIKKSFEHFRHLRHVKDMLVFVVCYTVFFRIMHTIVVEPLYART